MRAGLFLSAKYRAAKQRVEDRARAAMVGNVKAECPVRVQFQVWWPDRRQRDMMNYAKLLCDALKGIVFADDSLITRAEWVMEGIDRTTPRIVVTTFRDPMVR